MSALPDHPPLLRGAGSAVPSREVVPAEPLAACVAALDPGARALLDLSLRRRMPLRLMAVVLRTDPFDLARRRARAVARIAAELDLEGPGVVAMVKSALAALPDEVWGVPPVGDAAAKPVQADVMKVQAAALMAKLRQRQLEEADRRAREVAEAAVDDEVVDPLSLQSVFSAPVPSSPMFAGYARIAEADEDEVEVEVARQVAESEMLGSISDALKRAAESERAASLRPERADEPEPVIEGSAETIEFEAVRVEEPLAPVAAVAPPVAEPRALTFAGAPKRARTVARGGILVALIAALLRLLFRR